MNKIHAIRHSSNLLNEGTRRNGRKQVFWQKHAPDGSQASKLTFWQVFSGRRRSKQWYFLLTYFYKIGAAFYFWKHIVFGKTVKTINITLQQSQNWENQTAEQGITHTAKPQLVVHGASKGARSFRVGMRSLTHSSEVQNIFFPVKLSESGE